MADPARPALARTLAVLTAEPYAPAWETVASRVIVGPDGVRIRGLPGTYSTPPTRRPWLHSTPAEAQEALSADGVPPQGWCDDPRRGWHDRMAADDGWGDWRDVVLPAPRTIPDLVAVASLGLAAIQRAEELAREACRALAQFGCPTPERVVWRVGQRSPADAVLWRDRDLVVVSVRGVVLVGGRLDVRPDRRVVASAEALWDSGLALDRITRDAVVVVVPPVGGAL